MLSSSSEEGRDLRDGHLAAPHTRRAMEESSIWAEGPFEVTRAQSVFPVGATPFEIIGPAEESRNLPWSGKGPADVR